MLMFGFCKWSSNECCVLVFVFLYRCCLSLSVCGSYLCLVVVFVSVLVHVLLFGCVYSGPVCLRVVSCCRFEHCVMVCV